MPESREHWKEPCWGKQFWTKQEFKQFLETVEDKLETKMAFLLLYWTGMRIGELLALTYKDIDVEKAYNLYQ